MRIKGDNICQALIPVPVKALKISSYVLANVIPLYQVIVSHNASEN